MKTLFTTGRITKINTRIFCITSICFAFILMQSCVTTAYVPGPGTTTVVQTEVLPPEWAPDYDNVDQVHYYYLPDIDMYYDVWNHEYVYMNNGNWEFSASYPAYYSSYDINNAFVVVLDNHVSQPWRQNQYYSSHYPKYYYRSAYENRSSGNGGVRGFNENARVPIYRDSQRANSTPHRRYTEPNQGRSVTPANQQREHSENRQDMERRSNTTETNQSRNQNNQTQSRQDNSRENTNSNQQHMQRTDNSQQRTQPANNNQDHTQPANNSQQRTQPANNNQDHTQPANNSQQRTQPANNNQDHTQPANNNQENRQGSEGNHASTAPERRSSTQPNTNNQTAPVRTENTEQRKNTEPVRTQPAVYPGRQVNQPANGRTVAQPQPARENHAPARAEKKEVKKDESKGNSDNNNKRSR